MIDTNRKKRILVKQMIDGWGLCRVGGGVVVVSTERADFS